MDSSNESIDSENDANEFWKSLANLSEVEYLNAVLGPKYLPMQMVIPFTLVYVLFFVTGIFGNVATCIVIARNASMQTATNYYLFSLAISDLTLLIFGLPNELSVFWQQYPWMLGNVLCKIRSYVSETSSYVSVLTIVAFSMERYLAICHPLSAYSVSGLKRPMRFILAAWSIALISAIPFAVYTKVNYVEYPPGSGNYSTDSAICAMLLPDMPKFPLYELSSIVFFIIPMLLILVVYARMGLKIRRSTKNSFGTTFQGSIHGEHRQIQSRKTVVRMLSAVVVAFFLCWAPFHCQRLVYIYAQDADYYPDLNEWLYLLSGCLYYFSTTVNPFLYNVMSAKYRTAFKQMIFCTGKSRTRWSVADTRLCRCDSSEDGHSRGFGCSVRNTIDQAKEIFRFATGRSENDANGNVSGKTHRKVCALKKEDSTSKPLLESRHPTARKETSNESC